MKQQPNTELTRPTNGATLTLKEEFEIEKNAKNRAYSFIIYKDLMDEFSAWCKLTKDLDPFLLCRQLLNL